MIKDTLATWKVGRKTIKAVWEQIKGHDHGSIFVYVNDHCIGWGSLAHAQELANEAAGKDIWTA